MVNADVSAEPPSSAHEPLRKKSYEVLYLEDPIDEYVMQQLIEFDGRLLQPAAAHACCQSDRGMCSPCEPRPKGRKVSFGDAEVVDIPGRRELDCSEVEVHGVQPLGTDIGADVYSYVMHYKSILGEGMRKLTSISDFVISEFTRQIIESVETMVSKSLNAYELELIRNIVQECVDDWKALHPDTESLVATSSTPVVPMPRGGHGFQEKRNGKSRACRRSTKNQQVKPPSLPKGHDGKHKTS